MQEMTIWEILTDAGFWVIFAVTFFLGLTLGWFVAKSNLFWIIVALILFTPVINFLISADHWIFTLPFIIGFLVHTAKPICRKLLS